MIIPEMLLINGVRSLIKILGDDWNAQLDKTKSMLYDLFYSDDNGDRLGIDKYLFYEQSVALFTRTKENPRVIHVNMGYNMEQQGMLAIHVMLPKDSPGRFDAIGRGIGNIDSEYDVVNQVEKQTLVTTYDATYQLVITGDNQHEICLLYWYLKSCFVMLSDHLELMGLRNNRVSGADIRLDDGGQMGPFNIFHRSLQVSFDYEVHTKVNFVRQMADKIQLLFCASIDVDYDDATNDGGLIKAVIPTTVGKFCGTSGPVSTYEITTIGGESSYSPSSSQLMSLATKTPLLAFRDQSKMDIIRSGSPDTNQIYIAPNWTSISWSPMANPAEQFTILYT